MWSESHTQLVYLSIYLSAKRQQQQQPHLKVARYEFFLADRSTTTTTIRSDPHAELNVRPTQTAIHPVMFSGQIWGRGTNNIKYGIRNRHSLRWLALEDIQCRLADLANCNTNIIDPHSIQWIELLPAKALLFAMTFGDHLFYWS